MDAVSATAASTATTAASSTPASSTSSTTKTDDSKKSFSTLFAEAKDDLKKGETLNKVTGHEFGRIKGGTRDDMCINLSGNARNGQAFDLITRNGHTFHVYGGKGADHKVVEVGRKAAATTDTTTPATTDSTASTGTTTAADTTSGGTSATSGTGTTATTTSGTSSSDKTS
jgi:hypothetical protein